MDEIWRELAGRLHETGWDGEPLRLQHANNVVSIDLHAELEGKSSIVVTRFRAAYGCCEEFRCRVFRRSLSSDIAHLLGAQDIDVGDPAFDRAFVLRTNNPERLRAVLADAQLRAELLASPAQLVEVRDDEGWFGDEFPAGVDELYLEAEGRITDPAALERLYLLFCTLVERVSSGS